jgi:hypothetical protein
MDPDYSHSLERSPAELIRFAIGFGAFGLAAAGAVLSIPALAVFGAAGFLMVVASFGCCSES